MSHEYSNPEDGPFAGNPRERIVEVQTVEPAPKRLLSEADSAQRKRMPLCSGVLDYFPDAIAAVSEVSFEGNEKHNPGQPLHWSRGKSMDHADCIARHLVERGGWDGKIRHTAALAWRALALLQEELEAEKGLSTPRGAVDPQPAASKMVEKLLPGVLQKKPVRPHPYPNLQDTGE